LSIRAALPGVKIAVDKWHLTALANQAVTEVRQRVTRDQLVRRGTAAGRALPAAINEDAVPDEWNPVMPPQTAF